MTEHDEIRELLAMAVAGVLTRDEEDRIAAHLRRCSACSKEMEDWQSVADSLRRLPTPQPPARLLPVILARAEASLVEQAEESWNRRVMIFVIAFAWLVTVVSWPVVRLVSGGLQHMLLVPQLNSWISFAAFTALVWLAGGTAAVMLSLRQRRERRMA
ncbi:MAG: anti-sigma factor family protein [Terriglobia bacterium]